MSALTSSSCVSACGCDTKPSYGGGSITDGALRTDDIFLVDQFLDFIVTEANEKLIVGQETIGGEFAATIAQTPKQGATITQTPTQGGSITQRI